MHGWLTLLSYLCVILQIVVDLADSDSSVEEFEDASESFTGEDEMFIEEIGSRRLQPLSNILNIVKSLAVQVLRFLTHSFTFGVTLVKVEIEYTINFRNIQT